MWIRDDDEILYVPTTMPTEVSTYSGKYETEYGTTWHDWKTDMKKYFIYELKGSKPEVECWIQVYDDAALNYWIVGVESEYGLGTTNDQEYFGAEKDINLREDPRWGIEEANPVFAIGDEELYFAICIYDNDPADNSTFERGFIYFGQVLNDPPDNSTLYGFGNGWNYSTLLNLQVNLILIHYYILAKIGK